MIATHALSESAFDTLAAGVGDAAVIRQLCLAQVSRRKLQLRLLLDTSGSAALTRAYSLLAQATSRHKELEDQVLLQPHLGTWLSASLRHLQQPHPLEGALPAARTTSGAQTPSARRNGSASEAMGIRGEHKLGEPWYGYLVGLAASAAIQADLEFEIEAASYEGSVMLPMLGRLLTTDPSVVISHRGGRTKVGQTVLPREPGRDAPGWQGLRTLSSTDGGLTLRLWLDDVDPFRGNAVHPAASRLVHSQVRQWRKLLDAAWPLLVRHHRRYAVAIAEGLRTVVPLHSYRRTSGANVTNRDAFGAVAMTTPSSAEALAVGLVHEFQHGKLYALGDMVKLHDNDDKKYFYAPWRNDPRPLGAVLHGAYAFQGVTDFWRVQRHVDRKAKAAYAEAEFARWRDRVRVTTATLMAAPSFTSAGQRFVSGMWDAQQTWNSEPVSPAAAKLARVSSEDHWMSWRLRNRVPDHTAVAELSRRWLEGQDCPKGLVAAEVTGTNSVSLSSSVRVELLRLKTLDPSRFAALCERPARLARELPEASPGDLALATEQFERALALYRDQIAEGAGGINAWTGLALAGLRGEARVGALANAPELCLALYRRLCEAGTSPDLIELSRWLSPMSVAAPDHS